MQHDAGEGIDGHVRPLAGVHGVDVGLVDPGRHVDVGEVVGHRERGAGGHERPLDAVVDHHRGVGGGADAHLRLHEPALDADAPDHLVLAQLRALLRRPVDQGAARRRVDRDLGPVDLGVVGGDVTARHQDRHHQNDEQRDPGGALHPPPARGSGVDHLGRFGRGALAHGHLRFRR